MDCMAKKKSKGLAPSKKLAKSLKKEAKKNPKGFFIALAIVLVLALSCVGVYLYLNHKGLLRNPENDSSFESSSQYVSLQGDCDPISFHFIDREEPYSGDSIYVKAGDKDILIDAGARKGSASAIKDYLCDSGRGGDYVADGKLEYVISTHGHQDHIAGFVGNVDAKSPGGRNGLFHTFKIDNLIDFSYYDSSDGHSVINNADPSNSKGNERFVDYSSTYRTPGGKDSAHVSALYKDYVASRDYAISQGTIWRTASGLMENSQGESYTVELGKNLAMTVLYSYFYDHTSAEVAGLESSYKRSSFSDQNDYSVSLLFTQGSRNFLFTGDSEAYAEHSLAKYNALPHVDLFKAGHHGSYTASGEELLSRVTPFLCVVTCCAGNTEYASGASHTFPAQEFLDRISAYTDRVYVTTLGDMKDKSKFAPFNGNVVVSYSGESQESLLCSNSSSKLKDSEWMKANRVMPASWAA